VFPEGRFVTSRAGRRRSKPAPARPRRGTAERTAIDRVFPAAFRVLLCAALVLGTVYGFRRIRERALELERFRVRPEALSVVKQPVWASADVVGEIRRDVAGAPALSLFDPALKVALKDAASGSPWVAEVTGVRRRYPDRVVLSAKLRRPAAAVAVDGRGAPFALVDDRARVLKLSVADLRPWSERLGRRIVVVRGVRDSRLEVGQVSESRALLEAAAVARDLDSLAGPGSAPLVPVVSIDAGALLSARDGVDAGAVVETASGVRILWGHSSRTRRFGEPTVEDKVRMLRRVLAIYPGLAGLRTVDLRFPDPLVAERRRPDFPEE